jgi:hypothetical protein
MNDIVVRYHSPVKCTSAHDVLSIKRKTPEDRNSEVRTAQDGHRLSIKDRGKARLLSRSCASASIKLARNVSAKTAAIFIMAIVIKLSLFLFFE